jgi:hypothetical protein
MSPFLALIYSFLFGLLHGILPDEHTWPITFSYAIDASGKEQVLYPAAILIGEYLQLKIKGC